MRLTKRNISMALCIAITAATLFAACSKPDTSNTATTTTVPTDDIADAVSTAIAANTNGIAAEATAVSTFSAAKGAYTLSSGLPCGVPFDTVYTRTSNAGGGTYSYNVSWNYLLGCAAGAPDSLTVTQEMQGTCNLSVISAADSSSETWTINGLQPSSTSIDINGTYIRNGVESSKVRTMTTFTSIMTFDLTDVIVSKSTQQITGGTATVGISGAYRGINYVKTGYITFNTNNTATLTMDGNAYNIVLY